MAEERKIQHRVTGYAKKKYCLALKVNIGSQKGWPDYLFVTPRGEHFWIEFKAPGKKPSKLQQYRMDELSERGVNVFVCDNLERGVEIVDSMVST